MITMEDISIELGCSINTVSKALNNKPDVSPRTRQLVLDAAKRMGYVPNSLAKSLVTKTSGTIGIVVPSITISIYTEVIEAIMARAAKLDYSTFLAISSGDPDTETLAVENLYEKRVDGMIIIPVAKQPSYQKPFQLFGHPIVYIINDIDMEESYFVGFNLRDCAVAITQHILDKGAKKLALICSTRRGMSTDVERGFRETLLKNGMAESDICVYKPDVSRTPQDAGFEIVNMLDSHINDFDGIVLEHEFLYFGLHRLFEQHGLKCPENILAAACIGIGDRQSESLSLTSIDINPLQIGYDALSMLMDLIKYKGNAAIKKIVIPPKIIIRKSTKR